MKKDVGNDCQDMKNQRCIAQIVAAGCLADFLHIDLSQTGM